MGLGLLKFANKFLAKKGLVIKDINNYENAIVLNGNKWLQNQNINTIIDIGASDGGYAAVARNLFPNSIILSFEPIPESYEKLKLKFGDKANHKLYNLACSDSDQEIEFNQNEINDCSSLLEMADLHKTSYFKHTQEFKKIIVKSNKLDAVVQNLKLSDNILLKIDVQGSEAKVLLGAINTLKNVKIVFIETSFNELYKQQWLFNDTYSFLVKNGFRLVGIENVSQSIVDGTYLQMDAYFIKN